MIDILYPAINLFYALILAIVLVRNEHGIRFNKRRSELRMLLVAVLVFCLVSGLWGILTCGLFSLDGLKIYLSTVSVFFFLGLTSYMWIIFAIYYNRVLDLVKKPKHFVAHVSVPLAIFIVLIFSFIGDETYYFAEDGIFHRGDTLAALTLYLVLFVNYLLSFLITAYAYRKNKVNLKDSSDMILFHIIPVVFLVPQFFYPDKAFFTTGFFIAAVFMYLYDTLEYSRNSMILDNQRKNERILERSAEILFGDLSAEQTVDKLLETLAEYYSADYACILDSHDTEMSFYLNHEWKKKGLSSLFEQGPHLYYDVLGRALDSINRHGEIVINDTEELADENVTLYSMLKERGVHSFVASRLRKNGETVGLLVAANLNRNTKDVSIIRSVSTFLYGEIERLRANEVDDYRNKAIIDTLSADYSSIYYINLEKNEFMTYRADEYIRERYDNKFHGAVDYTAAINSYIENFVAEDQRTEMHSYLDLENIKHILTDKRIFSKNFICVLDGKESYFDMKLARAERDDGKFDAILGFADKDEEIREEREARLRSFGIISALSEEYDVIFYVDPETGDYEMYSDKNLEPDETGYNVIKGEDFFFEKDPSQGEVVYIDDRERARRFLSRDNLKKMFEETDEISFDLRLMIAGEPLWYRQKLVRIEDPFGNIKYVVGIRNIEAEKKAEIEKERTLEVISSQRDELEKQQKVLEKALADSEIAGKSKSDFLFNMSHDIRTPMNAIIGYTDLALKNYDDRSKVIDYLSKVKVSSNHLLKLINEVLDMSRIENGHVSIEESAMDIYNLGPHISAILGSVFEDNNLTFDINYREIEHKDIFCDKLHVDQIFINILSNAIKYTKSGGHVIFEVSEIEPENKGKARFRFVVEDNGVGMTPEFLTHIFESFSREESATKSGIQGTGLGMAITKSLIDVLGGTIDIKSERNVGTKVFIELEFRINGDGSGEENEEETKTDPSVLVGKRALIVDDNELNREITKEILNEFGLVVEEAEDGDVAVSKVQLSPIRYYDFVLMDIQMPHLDGYKATKLIRGSQDGRFAQLPIIAMTANAFEEDRQKALAAGMNAHIAKPVDVDTLIKTLCRYANV